MTAAAAAMLLVTAGARGAAWGLGEPRPRRPLPFVDVDDAAERYNERAQDPNEEPRAKNAALLLALGEADLEQGRAGDAFRSVSEALPVLRELQDADGEAECLRLAITAERLQTAQLQNYSTEALDTAGRQLACLRQRGGSQARRAEALMLLCMSEAAVQLGGDGRLFKALKAAKSAAARFESLGEKRMLAVALQNAANAHLLLRQCRQALQAAERALDAARAAGSRRREAKALHGVSTVHFFQGDRAKGMEYAEQALVIFRELDLRALIVCELHAMAQWCLQLDAAVEAIPLAEEATKLAADADLDVMWELACASALVSARLCDGQVDKALEAAVAAYARCQEGSDELAELEALEELLYAYRVAEQSNEAKSAIDEAIRRAKGAEDQQLEGFALRAMAEWHLQSGQADKAVVSARQSFAISRGLLDLSGQAEALLCEARVSLAAANTQQAVAKAKSAVTLFQFACLRPREAAAHFHLGTAHMVERSFKDAVSSASQALELFRMECDRGMEGRALHMIAECHNLDGNSGGALRFAKKAQAVFHEIHDHAQEAIVLQMVANVRVDLLVKMVQEVGSSRNLQQRIGLKVANLPIVHEALRSACEAAAFCNATSDMSGLGHSIYALAQVNLIIADYAMAKKLVVEARMLMAEIGDEHGEIIGFAIHARVCVAEGKFKAARGLCQQAMELAGGSPDAGVIELVSTIFNGIPDEAGEQDEEGAVAPVPEVEAEVVQASTRATTRVEDIRAGLRSRIQEMTKKLLHVQQLPTDVPLLAAGLDSTTMVQLKTEISKEFKVALPGSIFFDRPTVAELAAYIAAT